jgi:hypothetical protein
MATDVELWALAKAESRTAFMALYDRYSARLYDYVMQLLRTSITSTGIEEKVKQIIVHVFLTMWDNRRKLPQALSLEDHLFTSALYAAVDKSARIRYRLN